MYARSANIGHGLVPYLIQGLGHVINVIAVLGVRAWQAPQGDYNTTRNR